MAVIAIRKPASGPERARKIVASNQKAIDALPFNSGSWTVAGIPGLFVRCRAKSKSFELHRRVNSLLRKLTLGPLSMRDAKEKALSEWSSLRRRPKPDDVTFAEAFTRYLEEKSLAEATVINYRLNFNNLLTSWHKRTLREIGEDRAEMRNLQQTIKRKNGSAKMNQVVRLVSAVYNWQRKIDPTLPESPTTAVELDRIKPRDWAYSEEALRAWWHHVVEDQDGTKRQRGVKTLDAIKRAWWLTALFTGARPRSIENLRWSDVDLEKKTIHFRVTKADLPYIVPASDVMHQILVTYRDSSKRPPSEWVFPSIKRPGTHLIDVKNEKEGVPAKYRLRHSFKTTLVSLGFTPEQHKMLMGHALGGVSSGYITAPLVIESLRPVTNALANHYLKVLGVSVADLIGGCK
jgi:integrase